VVIVFKPFSIATALILLSFLEHIEPLKFKPQFKASIVGPSRIEEGYFEYGNFEFENSNFEKQSGELKTKWGTKSKVGN